MIGIHLVSHGDLCSGIIHSLNMIVGDTSQIEFTKLQEDSDIDIFKNQMLKTSKRLDTGQGIIVLADMFGTTPYNCALYNSKEFEKERYQIITGFNLPMLIEIALNREHMTLSELVNSVKTNFSETVVVADKLHN